MNKKTLHIAICSTSYYEYDRRIQRISSALLEAGYKISWLSRRKEVDSLPIPGITHHIIKTAASRGPRFYLQYNKAIQKALIDIKPDVINAIDLDTIIGCHGASSHLGKTLTFDAHEIYYEVPELIGKPLKKRIWKMVARRYLPQIHHAYTVNESLKEHYAKNYGVSYKVIRNVPDAEEVITTHRDRESIVYLGVLNAGRGLEIAIDAMNQLPEYKLHLIGEGDLSKQLISKATGLDNIIFHGYKKPSEIKAMLSTMGIGLNMLQAESLNYRLSLANKFFDYMHAGLPSINMDYPEYRRIISSDKVGLLAKDYSIEAMISAVTELQSPATYDLLASNALIARKKYCWAIEKNRLLQLYENIKQNIT